MKSLRGRSRVGVASNAFVALADFTSLQPVLSLPQQMDRRMIALHASSPEE
jgi:hypothetical protein